MKKMLLFIALFASALAGCKDEICGVSDYKIINQIESDIVVELKFGDKSVITIHPGDTQMIYHEQWCYDANVELNSLPVLLRAEMRIDGEVVPEYIWGNAYWDIDAGDIGDNYSSYTLTATEELINTIQNLQHQYE